MSEKHIPHSIATSTLTICGVELVCHVLDDGSRIIEAEGFHRFLDALGSGESRLTEEAAAEYMRWRTGPVIDGTAQ